MTAAPSIEPAFCSELRTKELLDALTTAGSILKTGAIIPKVVELRPGEPGILRCRARTADCGIDIPVRATGTPTRVLTLRYETLHVAIEACHRSVRGRFASKIDLLVVESESGDRLVIRSEDGLTIELPIDSDAGEVMSWPAVDDQSGVLVDDVIFGNLMRRIATHASKDMARINITGICFEHDGNEARLVATDGHRMAILHSRFPFPASQRLFDPTVALVVPIDKRFYMKFDGDNAFFETSDGTKSFCRVREIHTFPPWRMVVPYEFEKQSVEVDAERLLTTADAMRVLRGESETRSVRLAWPIPEQPLQVTLPVDGYGDGVQGSRFVRRFGSTAGSDTPVRVNPKYLAEACSVLAVHERVRIFWTGKYDPIVISTDEGLVIIMPCRSDDDDE